MVGQKILHYDVLAKLGEGGMGVVFKAHDTLLDRFVALKFLPDASRREADEDRLLQEARSAAMLNHPAICTIYGIEEYDGRKFLILEFVDGETVRAKTRTGPLGFDRILDWGLQAAEGLRVAHARGLIHRDVKSDNLMVTPEGRVKIMDFGLATLRSAGDAARTRTTVGTLSYMSPEQIQGGVVDHRTDIWSLGVVLYEMITGTLPFRGEHEAAVMYSILHEEPPSISLTRPNAPALVAAIIATALRKDPDQRYQSAETLVAELNVPPSGTVRIPGQKSLVVLPFDNMSPEKETEYFSDGLTDEVIARLSHIRSIRLISRTSAKHYKGLGLPVRKIARELQVEFVLEGSVRKHGRDLRITAQLIDASRDANVWAKTFRGTMDEVFDIQEEVASKIANGLEVQLTALEQKVLKKRYTENPEAYQLYLRGRYMWARRTEEDVRKGIHYFEQAIEKDPLYALAYHGLADSYNILGFYTFASPEQSFPGARSAAQKALELDTTLSEAMCSLAYAEHYYFWEWGKAEALYRRAIALKENYFTVHQFYANLLASMGELDASMAEFRKARELEPLSNIVNAAIGWTFNHQRKYDEAIAQLRQTIELNPAFFLAHLWLGTSYRRKGMMTEAIDACEKALSLSGGSTIALAGLGHAYAAAGRKQEADGILERLLALSKQKYVSAYYPALLCEALGDRDAALSWLERAARERSHYMMFLDVDPDLVPMRTDDRFVALRNSLDIKR